MHLEHDLAFAHSAVVATVATGVATIAVTVAVRTVTIAAAVGHGKTDGGTGTSCNSRITTKHGDTRAVLGPTERHHVLANVGSNNLTTLRISMREDVLDEIIAELIAGNWVCRVSLCSLGQVMQK